MGIAVWLTNIKPNLLKNVADLREDLLTCAVCVASGKSSFLGDVPFMLCVNLVFSVIH